MKKGSGKMPSYEGKLSDQEIDALIAHTRSLAPKKMEAVQLSVKPAAKDAPAK